MSRTTLYYLTPPTTDSFESLARDAERRARERGCECPRPGFRHFVGAHQVTTFVTHGDACPLRWAVESAALERLDRREHRNRGA